MLTLIVSMFGPRPVLTTWCHSGMKPYGTCDQPLKGKVDLRHAGRWKLLDYFNQKDLKKLRNSKPRTLSHILSTVWLRNMAPYHCNCPVSLYTTCSPCMARPLTECSRWRHNRLSLPPSCLAHPLLSSLATQHLLIQASQQLIHSCISCLACKFVLCLHISMKSCSIENWCLVLCQCYFFH